MVHNTYYIFFNDTATTEIYTLSLHDALPIWRRPGRTTAGPRRRPAARADAGAARRSCRRRRRRRLARLRQRLVHALSHGPHLLAQVAHVRGELPLSRALARGGDRQELAADVPQLHGDPLHLRVEAVQLLLRAVHGLELGVQ